MIITPASTKPSNKIDVLKFGDMEWVPNSTQCAIIAEHEKNKPMEIKPKERKPKLFILRGHPGSGKKTIALTMLAEGLADIIHQQDHFFVDDDDQYRFDESRVPEAVKYCYRNVEESLNKGLRVVVANNFTKIWTVDRYIQNAKRFGAEVVVMRATGDYPNVTGVPAYQVATVKKMYEPYPNEIVI